MSRIKFTGVAASPGIAIGPAYIISVERIRIPEAVVLPEIIEDEFGRFEKALAKSVNELTEMRDALASDEKVSKEILDAYLLIMDDTMFVEGVKTLIREQRYTAEYACQLTLDKMLAIFEQMDDPYFRERGFDLGDVAYHVINNLIGVSSPSFDDLKSGDVMIAHDLSPSQTASMPRNTAAAFVTEVGSRTSHTSIMARSIEIPAVVGCSGLMGVLRAGDLVIVDGLHGEVLVDPDSAEIKEYRKRQASYEALLERRKILSELPAKTLDGYRIELSANIELPAEMEAVIRHGADGVGLYRTEFLVMNRDDLPSEDEQFEVYRYVAENCLPHSAIVRTFDIGGDKFVSHLNIAPELNPYLGLRAIRFCLKNTDFFLTQLRAILRASGYGKLKIMFPMISSLNELLQAKGLVRRAMEDLKEQGIYYDKNIEIGIMIEVPSAALTADALADNCDFFSVGTNDLIQYTLAVDRGNEKIAYLYKPFSPSVIRLLYGIATIAHKRGIWAGVCGEITAIPAGAFLLLGMTYDELSASPIAIEEIKETIRSVKYVDARRVAEGTLRCSDDNEVLDYLENELKALGLDLGLS